MSKLEQEATSLKADSTERFALEAWRVPYTVMLRSEALYDIRKIVAAVGNPEDRIMQGIVEAAIEDVLRVMGLPSFGEEKSRSGG